ncbi:MAG: hypothetical protein RL754_362 [Bacteroidota bacterium]|jgi:gliding motility-associated-like protein
MKIRRILPLLVALLIPFQWVKAQCNVQIQSDTLAACTGDTLYLEATGAQNFTWSHDTTLSCVTCADPYIIVQDTTSYVVIEGQSTLTKNANNWNFSSGNTGFATNYTYNSTSIWNEGTYAIGPNPNAVHPNFSSWGDHTTGTGNYMLVNGATSSNTILWRQTQNFPPGSTVTMRWWMLTFATPAGSVQLKKYGTNVGGPASTPNTTGTWAQTSRTFTVGATGTVILNMLTLSNALAGNDFGLDDITFEYTCPSSDTVWIVPKNDAQFAVAIADTFACDSLCLFLENGLDTTNSLSYSWVFSNGTTSSDSIFEHCFTTPGDFSGYVITASAGGCVDSTFLGNFFVSPTRLLDSLVPYSEGGFWFDGIWVVDPAHPKIDIAVHHRSSIVGEDDSLVLNWGPSQNFVAQANSTLTTAISITPNNEPFELCAFLYNSEGCADSLCVSLAYLPEITVPNFFTPNADGINDLFEIQADNTEMLHQRIYNRWGALIFESFDPTVQWDGTHKGRPVASGVYFVEVEAINAYSEGRTIVKRSVVHIMP